MAENGAHFSGEGHLIEAVILGDPNKTVIPVVCDAQGRLVIDLTGSSITIGKVDQGAPGTQPWPVVEEPSTDATITTVVVTTSSTSLLGPNPNRRGIIIQSKDSPIYVILGSTPAFTTVYSYYVLKLNALEINDFFGSVSAVVATGTASVQITEKI